MKIRRMKKAAAVLLTAAVLLSSMLPAFSMPAKASDTGFIGTIKISDLQKLGLNTSTSGFSDKLSDTAPAPYGKETTGLLTFNELAYSENVSGLFGLGNSAGLYDADKSGDSNSDGLHFGSGVDSLDGAQKTTLNQNNDIDCVAEQSKAFDPTGGGKDDYVATVYAQSDGGNTDLKLKVARIVDNANEVKDYSLGVLYFQLEAYQENAFLPIAAGDFDGDGKDEIAVYRTAMSGSTGQQYVSILKYDPGKKSISDEKDYSMQNLGFIGVYDDATGQDDKFDPFSGTDHQWENVYYWPVANLCTVKQKGDACDDLVMSISSPKDGMHRVNTFTRVLFWTDPLGADSKLSSPVNMQFNWQSVYGISDGGNEYETMMFGGAGAADLDGDGYNDVVVAGYRQHVANYDNDYKPLDWSLEQNWYMAVRFTYDSATKSYGMVGTGPQYIDINDDHYNQNINMNEAIANGSSGTERPEIVKDPPDVVGFAEEGSGYADSVFINGFVVRWGDQVVPTKIPDSGIPSGNTGMSVNTAVSAMGHDGYFYVKYAVPINQIIAPDGYDTLDGYTGATDECRWIADAAAGNFDENLQGKQELIFTYACSDNTDTGSAKISYDVVGVKQKGEGDVTPDFANQKFDRSAADSYTHLCLSTLAVDKVSARPAFSLYACDTDDDSTLIKYDPTQKNEFYFTDPHVIAVLQSAPYFSVLDEYNGNYSSSGSTSITYTSGSGSSTSESVSVTAGILFGVDAELAVFIKEAEYSSISTLTASLGSEFENSTSVSKSVTFSSISGQDEVALTMTPYIRYHYQIWDPKSNDGAGGWHQTSVDIPEQPRTTEISADTYDKVAQDAGWDTVHGNLINDTPGDPSTYVSTSSGLDKWSSGSVVRDDGTTSSGFVGVGSGTGAISEELEADKSNSKSVTWGSELSHDEQLNIAGIVVGVTTSASYEGGNTTEDFSGHTYQGTVAVLPDEAAADYDFQWEFGAWAGTLNKAPCLVLGYLVQNVKCPPKAPENFRVTDCTEKSVSLAWDDDENPSAYEIYRKQGDRYFLLKKLDGSATSYTDASCDPNTEYIYKIRCCKPVDNVLLYSSYSDELSGYTNPNADSGSPVFTEQPENADVRSGATAVFSVTVKPGDGQDVSYQWQSYSGSGWEDITGAEDASYSVSGVAEAQSGNKYHCVVTQMVNNQFFSIVSTSASIQVGKGATTLDLDPVDKATVFDGISLKATVAEKFSGAGDITPAGTVTFAAKNDSTGESKTIGQADLESDWTASLDWTPDLAGSYTVTASYGGDGSLEACSGSLESVAVNPKAIDFTVQQPQDYQYTGKAINPDDFGVYDGEISTQKSLKKDTDYLLSYSDDCTDAGTVKITVTGIGNYEGSTGSTEFDIVPIDLWLTLSADTRSNSDGGKDLLLKAKATNAVDAPQGTVTFQQGDTVIAENVPIKDGAASYIWEDVPNGNYDLSAEYVPCDQDNYSFAETDSSKTTATVEIPTDGVKLNRSSLTLQAGGATAALTATVSPPGSDQTVSWSSDDPDIASVDNDGVVTPAAVGKTKITATTEDGSFTDSCEVTVQKDEGATTGVKLNHSSLTLKAGGPTASLTAAVSPSDATDQNVTWSSDDPGVADVDDNGVVTPVVAGKTKITVTTEDGSFTDACDVTVQDGDIHVTGVKLNRSAMTLKAGGDTETLTAAVSPFNATDRNISWSSDDPGVADVDDNGVVTPVAAGTAMITATTEDGALTDTCDVTVRDDVWVTGVKLSRSFLTLTEGRAVAALTATVSPADAADQVVSWSSDHPNIASVKDGVVTPVSAGSAVITVTAEDGAFTDTCDVTVEKSSPHNPSSGGSSSGSRSSPTVPTAPSPPANTLTDTSTGASLNLTGVSLPAGVSQVSFSATQVPSGGSEQSADTQGENLFKIVTSDSDLNVIGEPVIYNLKMLDQNGSAVTGFSGKVTVRIPVPSGLHGVPHVYRYEAGTETFTDMNATVENGFLVFETDHFSDYAIAGVGDSITLDTTSYQMAVGGQYQIGVKLTGNKAAAVKVYSTNEKTATVTRLANGNDQVTGKNLGTVYIMYDVYDNKNNLLTHASVRIGVKTGIRPRGDSTRQIGIF